MESNIATECSNLDALFQHIVADLKGGFSVWEDLTARASKLHGSLRTTIIAASGFLETFQKLADMALGTRGAASDLGSALTRLCLRQRTLEDKLKTFSNTLINLIAVPIQERLEEWRKNVAQLDKEHARESKRIRQDVRKAYSHTVHLKKKAKKGKPDVIRQLEMSLADYSTKYGSLEMLERSAVRTALLEERSHFCFLVRCLKPVMDCQVEMLTELTHIKDIMDTLHIQAAEPFVLSASNERVILDRRRMSAESGPLLTRHQVFSAACQMREHHCRDSQSSRKSSQSSASSNSCLPSPAHRSTMSWSTPKSNHSGGTSILSESSTVGECSSAGSNSTSVNLYAVPGSAANSKLASSDCPDEVFYFRSVSEPGTAFEYCSCGQPCCPQSAPVESAPLGGYVNMNQLASMAVEQQELCQKNTLPNDINKKPIDVVESSSEPSRSNLCSMHASLQSASATSNGCTNSGLDMAAGSQVIYSGVATLGRRSQSTERCLSPAQTIQPTAVHDQVISTVVGHSPSSAQHWSSCTAAQPSPSRGAETVDMLPLPLPPAVHLSMSYDDAVDEFPLPPPPLEMCSELEPLQDSRLSRRDMSRQVLPNDGPSESARVQEAARLRAASARRASEISQTGFSSGGAMVMGRRGVTDSCMVDDVLTATLKQGAKLKKTISRDRSAPRLRIQHL